MNSTNILQLCTAMVAACHLMNAEMVPLVLPSVVDKLKHQKYKCFSYFIMRTYFICIAFLITLMSLSLFNYDAPVPISVQLLFTGPCHCSIITHLSVSVFSYYLPVSIGVNLLFTCPGYWSDNTLLSLSCLVLL